MSCPFCFLLWPSDNMVMYICFSISSCFLLVSVFFPSLVSSLWTVTFTFYWIKTNVCIGQAINHCLYVYPCIQIYPNFQFLLTSSAIRHKNSTQHDWTSNELPRKGSCFDQDWATEQCRTFRLMSPDSEKMRQGIKEKHQESSYLLFDTIKPHHNNLQSPWRGWHAIREVQRAKMWEWDL